MIGSLIGLIKDKQPSLVLLEVSGVGYEVHVPLSTSFQLPNKGESTFILTILSGINVNGFVQSVIHQDVETLVHLPGIGKKTAERLIVEMKDKIQDTLQDPGLSQSTSSDGNTVLEARNALVNLGYKSSEARKMLEKIDSTGLEVEELLRQALKSVNK